MRSRNAKRVVDVRVPRAVAARLLAHGACAMGYPMTKSRFPEIAPELEGTWSTPRGPFTNGERILLRFLSEKGTKEFAAVPAVVRGDTHGTGPFMARFSPTLRKLE